MTQYASIDPFSGEVGISSTPPAYETSYEVPDGTEPDDIYIADGEVHFFPPRPAPYFTFDYAAGVWIDPRTPAEYAAYVLGVRQAARAPKIDFLRALVLGGAFSNDDIVDLAVGYFPASVKSSLNSLTPAEVLDLQLAWVSSTEVGRLDATITHVAAALGTSDEDLDTLFGITLDPPPAE